MKANLAVTLVGAALISLPVAAQTTSPADSPPKAATSGPAATPLFEMKAGQWRGTKLAGVPVYNNNHESIGAVNDLILTRDGKAEAVVIGVGGFLGMGEHLAAVPFGQVKWVDEPPKSVGTTPSPTATTGSGTTTPPATAPTGAGNAGRSPATATKTTADRTRNANRGYPDHAVVDMTKEQLKALPEVRYTR